MISNSDRPSSLGEVVGQERVRKQLTRMIDAARTQGRQPEHILLVGPGGLGKTSLARIVAHRLDAPLRRTTGGAVATMAAMARQLQTLKSGDVLFVDEFHGVLPKTREQILYPAMEDGEIFVEGDDGTDTVKCAPFTLVAATTEGKLHPSMVRRFGLRCDLGYYPVADLAEVIRRAAERKLFAIEPAAAHYLAVRAQGVPGVAITLMNRAADETDGAEVITVAHATAAMGLAEIDDLGLGPRERAILIVVARESVGKPIGLRSIASALGERDVSEEVALLTRLDLLRMSSGSPGRIATERAYLHLGYDSVPVLARGR